MVSQVNLILNLLSDRVDGKCSQSLLFVHYSIHFLGLVMGHDARKVTQKILNELYKEKQSSGRQINIKSRL